MKKLLLLVLALAAFSGCSRPPETVSMPQASENAPQAPAPAEAPSAVANRVVQMGSSIQKAQEAAKLQTESQNRTSAAVNEAVEAQ